MSFSPHRSAVEQRWRSRQRAPTTQPRTSTMPRRPKVSARRPRRRQRRAVAVNWAQLAQRWMHERDVAEQQQQQQQQQLQQLQQQQHHAAAAAAAAAAVAYARPPEYLHGHRAMLPPLPAQPSQSSPQHHRQPFGSTCTCAGERAACERRLLRLLHGAAVVNDAAATLSPSAARSSRRLVASATRIRAAAARLPRATATTCRRHARTAAAAAVARPLPSARARAFAATTTTAATTCHRSRWLGRRRALVRSRLMR